MFRLRATLLSAFRATYAEHDVIEVTSPCLVQTQVEGGSTLFKLDYYDHPPTSRRALTCIAKHVSRLFRTSTRRRVFVERTAIRVAI